MKGVDSGTESRQPTAYTEIEESSNAIVEETTTHLFVSGGILGYPDICDMVKYIFVMDANSEYIHLARKIDDLSFQTIAYELSLLFISIKFYQGTISLKYDGKVFDPNRYLVDTYPFHDQTIKVISYD